MKARKETTKLSLFPMTSENLQDEVVITLTCINFPRKFLFSAKDFSSKAKPLATLLHSFLEWLPFTTPLKSKMS